MRRGYILALCVIAGLGIGVVSYSKGGGSFSTKTKESVVKNDMPDTSSWQVYENQDFGFTFKFPRDFTMHRSFPGRLAAGKDKPDPATDPHIYDLMPQGADLTKKLPEVSLYVAPPGFFSCPPLDSSNDGTGYIDAPAQKIVVSGVPGLTRSGRVFGAATPADSYAREVYVCTARGYFRFSTPQLASRVFAGVLSTFRFTP